MCLRVLITTIAVQSGVQTHVWELVRFLKKTSHAVSVAVRLLPRDQGTSAYPKIGVPVYTYRKTDDLVHIVQQCRTQLIHAQSSATFPSAVQTSLRLRLPLIVTLHGGWQWQKYRPVTLAQAASIIAISPEAVRSAGTKHLRKIHLIYNGVD